MQIQKVRVEGFRLLNDAEIMLERGTTLIVGRNNSGKTSLTDIFEKMLGEGAPKIKLEDFAAAKRAKFIEARDKYKAGDAADLVSAALPTISITLTYEYDPAEELGPLSPFVIDLDPSIKQAVVKAEYKADPKSIGLLFESPPGQDGENDKRSFFRHVRENISKAYSLHVKAVDPTDPANERIFDGLSGLSVLMHCGFVGAQRTLDHAKQGETDVIGKLLGTLFHTANSINAAQADQDLAAALRTAVVGIEGQIQDGFDDLLKGLLPALAVFGFPSFKDTELRPLTSLDVKALLSDHTKIFYEGVDGVHLPEGYNGLGTRNLIYMLLKLESFHKEYRAKSVRPGVHLVFIEEPEAHLHPQMQEVFISQLGKAVSELSKKYPNEPEWQVQFVVSTHSSHVANAASFDSIRYFLSDGLKGGGRTTKVKDFRKGLSSIPSDDRDFLHQYMTLTKCDLYFADKAVLVEGTTERILMPRIRTLVDNDLPDEKKLAHQYLTTVEVGGGYSNKFFALLDFLELKSLVITDIDSVFLDDTGQKRRWKKCPVSKGERTSNAAIKAWFGIEPGEELKPDQLAIKTPDEKTKGFRRLSYQIAEVEGGPCARSFEDALILANPNNFELEGGDVGDAAWDHAQEMTKSDVALEYALRKETWNVPRYIKEGMRWLSEPPPPPAEPPIDDLVGEKTQA